jgi:hypothetical protein
VDERQYWFLYDTKTGEIVQGWKGITNGWFDLPPGLAAIGPFDLTDPDATAAYNGSTPYVVRNGALTAKPASSDAQLQQAKDAKLYELQTACQNAINALYTDPTVTDLIAAITNLRTSYFNCRNAVLNANTVDEINAISLS